MAIALGLNFWIKNYYRREYYYISPLDIMNNMNIVIIAMAALFIVYLIKEFEIKRIVNIFQLDSKEGLVCGENLKSFLLILLKIAAFFGVGGIIIREVKLPKSVVYLMGIAILTYTFIALYYELTIKFVKGRVEDELSEEKKEYSWFRK